MKQLHLARQARQTLCELRIANCGERGKSRQRKERKKEEKQNGKEKWRKKLIFFFIRFVRES